MFRRSDKGEGTGNDGDAAKPFSNTAPLPEELAELDDLGAPKIWTFATAVAWCRRHNWHLDGIDQGSAVWLAGAAYMAKLVTVVTPEMSVSTPATFDRAGQTGEWALWIHDLRGSVVYSCATKVP